MRNKNDAVDRFLRLPAIVGPHGLLPISRSSFYAGVKLGVFPKPIRLGKRISVWRLSDLQRAISSGAR